MSKRDIKYMLLAQTIASMSKAINAKVGAVLVRDNTVISTGYNGPPRGIEEVDNWTRFPPQVRKKIMDNANLKHGEINDEKYKLLLLSNNTCHLKVTYDPRYLLGYKSGEGMKWMIDAHAERNCIINAARAGVSTLGTTMYAYCGLPCKECMIEIINAGIEKIVCLAKDNIIKDEDLTENNINDYNLYLSRWLCENSKIELIEIDLEDIQTTRPKEIN